MGAFQTKRNQSIRNRALKLKLKTTTNSSVLNQIRRYEQSIYNGTWSSSSRILGSTKMTLYSENYPRFYHILSTVPERGTRDRDSANDQYFHHRDELIDTSCLDDFDSEWVSNGQTKVQLNLTPSLQNKSNSPRSETPRTTSERQKNESNKVIK